MFKASVQKQLRSLVFSQTARRSALFAAHPSQVSASRSTWATRSFSMSSARLEDFNRQPGGPSEPTTTIYLGNLPYTATDEDLRDAGEQFGSVKRVSLGRFLDTGKSRGYAHIEFEDVESAKKMMQAHQEDPFYFGNRATRVDYARPSNRTFTRAPRKDGERADWARDE
ncbi:RNA-binding domain-containing protein [Neolentinus lepideus HHB14362 ss-1]|uniref:RNA-binding domain-containing protein n=1 Tax=Neolentinus lepideus HHB14362 ss-1 TaxID=1314782 RepID=A0A165SDL3_9AGAM|nr:RNA-binding domain-containing protein [Neolentinus lepideus HHB14362 ss-1]